MDKHEKTSGEKQSRWQLFFKNIQQDLKLYLVVLLVFCIYRIGFIGALHQYLNEASTFKDILVALYYGARISLKSAGVITLLTFLLSTIMNTIFVERRFEQIRLALGSIYILILSLLFNARIPFYQDFHVAFNQFIFNTFNDDVVALGHTMMEQYQLPWRLLAAFVFAALLSWGLKQVLATKTLQLPQFSRWYHTLLFRSGIILGIGLFMVFARFGGGLTYGSSIKWENAAMTTDEFLNEAILDDVQALYRAYSSYKRLKEASGLHVEAGRIGEYATQLAGRGIDSHNMDDFLRKQAQGAKIAKPKHIFIIVGESHAAWPLLPQYKELNIANGLKGIMAEKNAAYIPGFMSNAIGTMEAMNGFITGLAEVNLSPNYQPKAYQEQYSTAMAPQMKKLGYKTYLWYGGFSSWQKIKEFSLAQGFDEFYASNDMADQSGNAWGSEDKNFLRGISTLFKDDQPSVHVILTTSNHPPFTVDVAQEGFDPETVMNGLPDQLKTDKEVITKLGHFWYADHFITEFIQTMYQQYPDSIFVVTGDHGDRFNIEANPKMFERYAVPFILYGKGVNHDLFPQNTAGSHISIVPTLIELIAPKGFEYYSLGESLTKPNMVGVSRDLWVTADRIGTNDFRVVEGIPWVQGNQVEPDQNKIKLDIDAVQALSWWMIKNGKNME